MNSDPLAGSTTLLPEERANASHLYAGALLILLAVGFLISLSAAEGFVTLLLVFLYSNLIPSLAVLLCYHLVRKDREPTHRQVRPSELLLIALISTFALPIVTLYFIPLAVVSIGLVLHASQSSSFAGHMKGTARLAVAGMLLWPGAMVATVVLSLIGPGNNFNPLFTGVGLTWAIIGFEIGILGFAGGTGKDGGERELKRPRWIERIALLTAVGMSLLIGLVVWVRLIPDFGLQDRLFDVLVLTVALSPAVTGLSNLVVLAHSKFGPIDYAAGR